MIAYTEELEAKCKAALCRIDFDGACAGIYMYIKDVCGPTPVGEEKDFIEAVVLLKLAKRLIEHWHAGCVSAQLDPEVVKSKLVELEV